MILCRRLMFGADWVQGEQDNWDHQGWVMRQFARTNARMIQTICVFNVYASALRGPF